MKQAVLLAGGLGTRLKGVVSDVPKPMADILGRPFLEYQLDYLIDQGIERLVMAIGYKGEIISDHFKDQYKSIKISYAIENEPLGTGGAILNALKDIDDEVCVLNGDTLFEVDLREMYTTWNQSNSDVAMALRKIDNAARFGTVSLDQTDRIVSFNEKDGQEKEGVINGGIYMFNAGLLKNIDLPTKFSIEKDVFEKMLAEIKISGFISTNYFLDIGIPEDYRKAQDDFKRFNLR